MIQPRRGLVVWASAGLLLAAGGPAAAVIPVGSFEIVLDGNQSIWLDAGDQQQAFCEGFEAGFGGTLESCSLEIRVDPKGKLAGSAQLSAENAGVALDLAGPVRGRLRGDDRTGLTDLAFSLSLTGAAANGAAAPVSAEAGFEGQVDAMGTLTGAWDFRFCPAGAACVADMDVQGPESLDDGDWTLGLEIVDLGDGRLGGSAIATLDDDFRCLYAVTGRYSPSRDDAKLKLEPSQAACDKTKISLKSVQLDGTLTAQIVYKLFGFRGSASLESEP
jgi:hypothetical protein